MSSFLFDLFVELIECSIVLMHQFSIFTCQLFIKCFIGKWSLCTTFTVTIPSPVSMMKGNNEHTLSRFHSLVGLRKVTYLSFGGLEVLPHKYVPQEILMLTLK